MWNVIYFFRTINLLLKYALHPTELTFCKFKQNVCVMNLLSTTNMSVSMLKIIPQNQRVLIFTKMLKIESPESSFIASNLKGTPLNFEHSVSYITQVVDMYPHTDICVVYINRIRGKSLHIHLALENVLLEYWKHI